MRFREREGRPAASVREIEDVMGMDGVADVAGVAEPARANPIRYLHRWLFVLVSK